MWGKRVSKAQPGTDYERSDVSPALLAALAGGLALTVALLLFALRIAYPGAARPEERGPLQPLPVQPRLEPAPGQRLQAYRQQESKKLQGIDQAMRAVAARGWNDGR